ncbi:MAG TPA: hypothetical protein PLO37_22950 [Candidatus Hydrogenedentes bacterium]|nr:hypothetical protein [Candidatus Hydrogenedentota bacterium]HPG69717.1 hypothetical protein [Candidatus Hydrogenedentota bacterium]
MLCEDRAHDVFVTRFLTRKWGIDRRDVRVVDYPRDEGSGRRHVEDKIEEEGRAFRSRNSHAATILLIVRDADENSVGDVRDRLDERLGLARGADESIVYIIPKWHIEAWIAYLSGDSVDEDEKSEYKKRYGNVAKSKDCHGLVDSLAVKCKEQASLDDPPPSLVEACQEFERIRGALRSR